MRSFSVCLAATALAAASAKVPQLMCGNDQPVNKIHGSPELDGAPEYMATINGMS
jgi:hypothetical protein